VEVGDVVGVAVGAVGYGVGNSVGYTVGATVGNDVGNAVSGTQDEPVFLCAMARPSQHDAVPSAASFTMRFAPASSSTTMFPPSSTSSERMDSIFETDTSASWATVTCEHGSGQ
jgi:hypothetical protein